MKDRTIIELHNIIKRFYIGQPNELEILHGVNLNVREGEFVSIVGASGSGKTTLMNIIGVLDRPTEGGYILDGVDVSKAKDKELSGIRNQKIGFVFQTYNLISRTSALRNVELPMMYAGVGKKERQERAKHYLEMVGMQDRMSHKPDELSGGQKQRVSIARAMTNNPSIILADEPTGALDSRTGRKIMDIFHRLNQEEGKTIVLITHSNELAEETQRIIIGIASVIAIMSVGNSISTSVTSSMEEMGVNNITLGVSQKSTEDTVTSDGRVFAGISRGSEMSDEDYITDEMLNAMEAVFADSVTGILLSESAGSGTAEDGSLTANVNITGVNTAYLENEELTLLAGRTLTERDQNEAKRVALVSDKLADNLFEGDYNAAIGSEISIYVSNRYYTYAIAGVYEYDDSGFSAEAEEDVTTTVYLPLETAREQNHSSTGYSQLTIVTASGVDSTTLCDELETWFNNNYYRSNDSFEVTASSMESMVSSMTEMLSTVSIAISVIAGISLLVGGIGVMNIMLVSITERTREIGTRKALGATNGSIRLQFIMESIVICLTGGFIGILLGLILAAVATNLLGYAASPSIGGIIFSVSFSILIGVFFGYYPANKAAKMNPIEALRYE
ncbi:MAG TPA: ATP-binding cassette domain-containing protein [Candidatus Merdisoma merdipullorum]|nr:ATP-binding cassette domain-containing protein [Candidatus Merdisoma merdipullorum]